MSRTIKNQKDILRAKIDFAFDLDEELEHYKEKIQDLQKKRTEQYFMKFLKNEAKHDAEVAKLLLNKDMNPKAFQAFKEKYIRSIEKEEHLYESIIESIENHIESNKMNEEEFHTIENLTNAVRNLENPNSKSFRERMVDRREERRMNK